MKIITDRETGRPRGFGFVDMPTDDAQNAIQHLNGFDMNGRPLRVNEARERAAPARRAAARWRRSGDRWGGRSSRIGRPTITQPEFSLTDMSLC